MKERPILFNAEMVRAILDGRKTQTRRVIKTPFTPIEFTRWHPDDPSIALFAGDDPDGYVNHWCDRCPYGVPGDRLWVRETIRKRILGNRVSGATYLADLTAVMGHGPAGSYLNGRALCNWKWKRDVLPSIFMPRRASRITLEVTGVRVERAQAISMADACTEGFPPIAPDDPMPHLDRIMQPFIWLESRWDSINAKRGYSWKSNPWVWVVEFVRAETR